MTQYVPLLQFVAEMYGLADTHVPFQLVLGLNIGMGYKNMGKPDEAIPFLEECLQRAPGYARCRQVREEIRASFHK